MNHIRVTVSLLELRPSKAAAPELAHFAGQIASRARSAGPNRAWAHVAGWNGVPLVTAKQADLASWESAELDLGKGYHMKISFLEMGPTGLVNWRSALRKDKETRLATQGRSEASSEAYDVIEWSSSSRALVLVTRIDLLP